MKTGLLLFVAAAIVIVLVQQPKARRSRAVRDYRHYYGLPE